jgi:hypothetical protein
MDEEQMMQMMGGKDGRGVDGGMGGGMGGELKPQRPEEKPERKWVKALLCPVCETVTETLLAEKRSLTGAMGGKGASETGAGGAERAGKAASEDTVLISI